MPEIEQSFAVDRPPEVVWAFFQNVPEVAACMPGCELTEEVDSNTFRGKVSVKIGPISAAFEGEAVLAEVDEAAQRGRIEAKGIDRKGGSRASATVKYALTRQDGGTAVDLTGDIKFQGALAQFGRTGIIREVSSRLTQEFANCLRAKLAATSPEEAAAIHADEVKGVRLVAGVIGNKIKGVFRRDDDDEAAATKEEH